MRMHISSYYNYVLQMFYHIITWSDVVCIYDKNCNKIINEILRWKQCDGRVKVASILQTSVLIYTLYPVKHGT